MSVINRFSTTDRTILGGSILVLLILSYLLYDDSIFFPTNKNKNQQAIGTISISENDVRRKNNDNFIWLPGNKKDEIYNRDSIFTGDHSQASITLNDGSLIQIQENSLVNLNLANGQMQLDLRFGQFTGSSTPLRVKSGNEEYVIDGKNTKFEINRSASGTLDVKVLSGKMQIKSSKGNQSLNSNESLQISKNGAEKSQIEASIRLRTKDDIYLYRLREKDPVLFEWEGRGPLAQYQIEISKTEDFKKVLSLRSTIDQKIAIKDVLHEGSYYWRVKGLNIRRKMLTTSEKRRFYLSYMPAPQIQSPDDKEILQLQALNTPKGLRAPTKINWNGDSRLLQYEWQLSEEPGFQETLDHKTLTVKEIQTAELPQGTYYTRVRGIDKDKRPSPWSKIHAFQLKITTEQKPPAPRLVEKRIRFQIPKEQTRTLSAENLPQMAWSEVDVAKDYRWELAKTPSFAGAQTTETPRTRVAWTDYKPGKYYYRVYARTSLGQSSDPSETGVLEVFNDQPILEPIPAALVKDTNINATAPSKSVRAKWSPIMDAKSYLIQVDKSEDFTAPVQLEVQDSQSDILLPEPGKYFVRVKALNDSAVEMTEFSNVQDAVYVFKVTLEAPKLLEPYDKTTVFLQKDMEPLIWLEWAAVPNAEKYLLEASTTPDFARPILSKELLDTRFLIKEKVPYGNIFWRVKALSQEEDLSSEWSSRQFILYHQKNRGF